MSKVVIGVSKYFEGAQSGPGGALLNIIPLADATGKALDRDTQQKRRRENLIVPIGDRGESTELDLPAGQYLARVRLPSGEILDSQFSAVDSGPVHINLTAAPSRHEWLSWQHFGGNTSARPSNVQLRARTTPAPSDAKPKAAFPHVAQANLRQAFTAFDVGPLAQGPYGDGRLWDAVLKANEDKPDAWQRFGNAAAPDCWSGELLQTDREDQDFSLVRTSRNDARWENRTQDSWRQFFVVSTSLALEIATVPLAWRRFNAVPPFSVELLVHMQAAENAFLTRTVITDETSSAMLSYLAQGRADLARPFVEHARGLLFDKIENPLGAAAGGYVLLANASAAGDSNWQNWTGNLMSMAPWLPDGAILHGIRRLRMGTKEDDFRQAGRVLLEGFRRGVPFFSMGIQLLQEGLLQTAHQWKEKDAVQALKTVNAVAAHLDSAQPFTTLRFERG